MSNEIRSGRIEIVDVDWPDLLHLAGWSKRRIWVWLPEQYDQSIDEFSVLFMHDGQNVFRDTDATYGTCWRMIEAQEQLAQPMIVVAIEGQNDALRRFGEFSPWVNKQMDQWKGYQDPYAGGLADQYLTFVAETIVPTIHLKYRCRRDAEHNFMGGSSMGGVVSLYAATHYEHIFRGYMAMSTATWFAHEPLLSCLQQHRFQSNTRLYADIGTKESSNDQREDFPLVYLNGNRALFEVLEQKIDNNHFFCTIAENAVHNEAAWSQRLPAALVWLTK